MAVSLSRLLGLLRSIPGGWDVRLWGTRHFLAVEAPGPSKGGKRVGMGSRSVSTMSRGLTRCARP